MTIEIADKLVKLRKIWLFPEELADKLGISDKRLVNGNAPKLLQY